MALENPRGVSPEKMASNLKKAASDGSRDIQRFKKDFQSQEMKDLWQKTSNAEFPQGRDPWTVDYQALVRGAGAETNNIKIDIGDKPATTETTPEDEEAALKHFQDSSSTLKITRASQADLYPLSVTVDELSFYVTQQEHEGVKFLTIEPHPNSGNSDLTREITGLIVGRKNSSSLQELLVNVLSR